MSYLKRKRRDADRILPLTSDCLEMLRIYSVERRQKWGRKERKVESEDEGDAGRVMETQDIR